MLVIFAKLDIPARDRAEIEAIRQRHDALYGRVEPHFTLVFPFAGVSVGEVLGHVQHIATEVEPIPFKLAKIAAVRDPLSPGAHLFFLPDEGVQQITDLHDRLYSGVLATRLHPTAAYLPHVTVGRFERYEDAKTAAASLSAVDIPGRLSVMTIGDFDGEGVEDLHNVRLGAP
ncbi:MAG: 2'-5' RNA ligase family protein [Brevundimonas sp.]|uniref:2'-5' RNA ligase family protein n=1 Tax=Brevundimonas sp. TaxID=1871086 RepID=UPI003918A8C8